MSAQGRVLKRDTCDASAQNLYERGLIRTINVNIRAPSGSGSRINTTMLQLPRFLLQLEPGQMLRVLHLPMQLAPSMLVSPC